jgi:hypothetical protein
MIILIASAKNNFLLRYVTLRFQLLHSVKKSIYTAATSAIQEELLLRRRERAMWTNTQKEEGKIEKRRGESRERIRMIERSSSPFRIERNL